jgi:hypothetical protein
MATVDSRVGAVYVGWTTFTNALDTLSDAMPNRIDRTVFPGLAGGVQGQLLTGLKFLGLVTADGKPTEALRALAVRDEDDRKKQLEKVLRASYAHLFALDLATTTTGELRDKMSESYNVTGDTTTRAMRFFIAALQYAGVPLSSHVSKIAPTSNGAPRRRRVSRTRRDAPPPLDPPPITTPGTSKTVKIASGGTVTVSATLDLFSLSQKDRTFVFDLIDKLDGYAKEFPVTDEQEEEP